MVDSSVESESDRITGLYGGSLCIRSRGADIASQVVR